MPSFLGCQREVMTRWLLRLVWRASCEDPWDCEGPGMQVKGGSHGGGVQLLFVPVTPACLPRLMESRVFTKSPAGPGQEAAAPRDTQVDGPASQAVCSRL